MFNMFVVMLACVGIVLVVGWQVGSALRRARLCSGFKEWSGDIRRLRSVLRQGELRREYDDVVVSGRFRQLPVDIRLSQSDTTPGLCVTVTAPAGFQFSLASGDRRKFGGKTIVRLNHSMLDRIFVARSDHPVEAKLFFSEASTLTCLTKLCYSRKTILTFDKGKIELCEDLIPVSLCDDIVRKLESLATLSKALESMPGAYRFAVQPDPGHAKRQTVAFGLAGALVLAFIGLFFHPRSTARPVQLVQAATIPKGIAPADAASIPNLNGWKLANVEEIGPDSPDWLRSYGLTLDSTAQLDAQGHGSATCTAYLLVSKTGGEVRRMVWIVDHRVLFDMEGKAAGIARIPKTDFRSLNWEENAPVSGSDGDGLLLVRDNTKPESATVFYLAHGTVQTSNLELQP